MALLRCEDCGKDVSSRAAACPNCGCPVPQAVSQESAKHTASVLPRAWTEPAPEPVAAKTPSPPSSPAMVRLFKWAGVLIVLVLLIRACGSSGSEDVPTPPVSTTTDAPPTAPPPGPTDADKQRWAKELTAGTGSAAYRERIASDLVKHFPQTPEGQKAAEMLAALKEEVAYEAIGPQWSYQTSDEGMSGKPVRTASVTSTNTISLDFPYAGPQRGQLLLRRHPRWGNDVIFSIEKGQVLCHSYGDCDVRVRFDDGQVLRYQGTEPSDNSTEYVFIPAFSTFMKRLPKAKVAKVEVQIYQSGVQVFEFDVSGFKPEKFK